MFKYEITAFKVYHRDGYDDVITTQGDVLRVTGAPVHPMDKLNVFMEGGRIKLISRVKQPQS